MSEGSSANERPVHPAVLRARERARKKADRRRQGWHWEIGYWIWELCSTLGHLIKWW